MRDGITHIVEVMADPHSITYFNLFAEYSKKHPNIKISFITLNKIPPPVLKDMKERGCDAYWVSLIILKELKVG